MPHVLQAYRTNPGGSITFVDVPASSSAGSSSPQGTTFGDVAYEDYPASRVQQITFTALPIAVVKNGATCGFGSKLIYTLPRGVTQYLGANVSLTLAAVPTGGLVTGAAVVSALGTTAATNADALLTSTEATWVASTASTLTAFNGAFSAGATTAPATLSDDRTTQRNVYLNFACPGADIAGDTTIAVTGTVKFAFSVI